MRLWTPVTLIVCLLGVPAMPADKKPESKPPAKAEKKDDVPVFTNEDLERKYGPSTAAPKTAPTPEGANPLETLLARQAAGREKAVQREEARKHVQAAQDKVRDLEKRQAKLRNPLLGRVQPAPDEEKDWAAADQAGRLTMTRNDLAAAREELEEALKALADLR